MNVGFYVFYYLRYGKLHIIPQKECTKIGLLK